LPVPDLPAADFHPASLTCPQLKRRTMDSRGPALVEGTETSRLSDVGYGANRFAALKKGTSAQQLIASKGLRRQPI
jgi:hypothetical protein